MRGYLIRNIRYLGELVRIKSANLNRFEDEFSIRLFSLQNSIFERVQGVTIS